MSNPNMYYSSGIYICTAHVLIILNSDVFLFTDKFIQNIQMFNCLLLHSGCNKYVVPIQCAIVY